MDKVETRILKHLAIVSLVAGVFLLSGSLGRTVAFGVFLIVYGFFAWLEHDDPESITEACAQHHVYLVPLRGGIRIGLCAIPSDGIERVAKTLADVLN